MQIDTVILGDAYEVLRTFPNNSVNLIITSPPYYKQRDYGSMGIGNEDTMEEYLEKLIEIFGECIRIVREDGSIVFNLGDKYINGSLSLIPYRFAIMVMEKYNSVKLINNITWVKRNPTPRQHRKRLVQSTEPFFHFVKSPNYYFDIDSFMKEDRETKYNGKRKNPGERYFKLIEQSELSKEEKEEAKRELEKVINEVKQGLIKDFRMKIRGIHAEPFGGQEGGRLYHLRNKGFTIIRIKGEPIKRDVIECSVETIKGRKHSAIYPKKLVLELIKMLSKKGDIILDPFAGSGTTLVAAYELERHYIGIEINPEYYKYITERLEEARRCKTKNEQRELY